MTAALALVLFLLTLGGGIALLCLRRRRKSGLLLAGGIVLLVLALLLAGIWPRARCCSCPSGKAPGQKEKMKKLFSDFTDI